MIITHAECEVNYTGRGDTLLPKHDRLIIQKEDGSVSIHTDKGVKPLNYMGAKTKHTQETNPNTGLTEWHFDSSKESITITLYKIYSQYNPNLTPEDPGLERDGTEDQLQEWLANNLSTITPHLTFKEREHETTEGRVDIYATDENGVGHLVEVKRVATSPAIHQIRRYVNAYNTSHQLTGENQVKGILICLEIRPTAEKLALKYDIPYYIVPGFWKKDKTKTQKKTNV